MLRGPDASRRWAVWSFFGCLAGLAFSSGLAVQGMATAGGRVVDALTYVAVLSMCIAYLGRAWLKLAERQELNSRSGISLAVPVVASVAMLAAAIALGIAVTGRAVAFGVQVGVLAACVVSGSVAGLLWRVWLEHTPSDSSARKYLHSADPLSRPKHD